MKKTPMIPPLDPDFMPAVMFNSRYLASVKSTGKAIPVVIGLERENGLLARFETVIRPETDHDTLRYVERLVKFMVWAYGGWKIFVGGPKPVGEYLKRCYAQGGTRAFDADLMGRVYERSFDVVCTDAAKVPPAKSAASKTGGHLDGCRIGFDLGASDFKVAAVNEGVAVYSEEFPWNPKDQNDPAYHYSHLNTGLKKAAEHLPRVDAIGGSSAGVIVNNRIMVASLLRGIPPDKFKEASDIFLKIRKEWNVPLEVANDGDVTALAGAMSLGTNAMLGVAMGSSQAGGYLDPKGCMTGRLTELAFVPVDYNPAAPADEWSGDNGVGALYFSQQAVSKLLPAAGIELPAGMGQPEKLKEVQSLMDKGDKRATGIYETIGVYLGYAVPYYTDFYEFKNMLILGRVTTGPGGDIILRTARKLLERQFPETAANVMLHVPDEKSRRVGQAVAAASLPAMKK